VFGDGAETRHWLVGTRLVGRSVLVSGSCRCGVGPLDYSHLSLRKLALVLYRPLGVSFLMAGGSCCRVAGLLKEFINGTWVIVFADGETV
jgi:hypothetical protein